jgi:hypothetical protein
MFNSDFEEFWDAYPRKVGKLAAQKAYGAARRKASAEAILAGVMAYKRHMPHDPMFRPHPATWLNAGRWMDEDVPVSRRQADGRIDWFEQCKQVHGGECGLDRYRHMTRMQMEQVR